MGQSLLADYSDGRSYSFGQQTQVFESDTVFFFSCGPASPLDAFNVKLSVKHSATLEPKDRSLEPRTAVFVPKTVSQPVACTGLDKASRCRCIGNASTPIRNDGWLVLR